MRISKFYVSTLKEAPAEADIASQKLMLRAGLIKKLGSGLYTWMPLGLITLRKVEAIVREEMNRAGALELVMPVIQPAELWQESGRWEKMGPLMLRLQDRQKRDFIVGPTHEEVITDIVRREIRSYKQMPVNFYQIQTKFRDEIRPRFGVMRAREFVMKDAYSFDADEAGMLRSYRIMHEAYSRIFTRMGLQFRAVDADSGRDRRCAVVRIPGAGRFRRGRHRVQQRLGLRGQRRKGRGARACVFASRARRGQDPRAYAGQVDVRGSRGTAAAAACAHGEMPDAVGRRPRAHAARCAAITWATK